MKQERARLRSDGKLTKKPPGSPSFDDKNNNKSTQKGWQSDGLVPPNGRSARDKRGKEYTGSRKRQNDDEERNGQRQKQPDRELPRKPNDGEERG